MRFSPPRVGAYLLERTSVATLGIIEMDELARHIEQCLSKRGFCVVFEDELERCWPSEKIDLGDREETIQSFAKSHGWIVSVLNSDFGGTRAIFESHSRTAGPY